MSAENFINFSRITCKSEEKPPFKLYKAVLREASVLLAIKSATASACVKSSLPFKKARWVNSPGFANLAPFKINNCSSESCIKGEP